LTPNIILLCFLLILVSEGCYAQQSVSGLSKTFSLLEVEVTGNSDEKENPLSVVKINNAFIEKSNCNSLMSSLERIPGINVINLGTNIGKPVIRGLSFNRVIVNNGGIKQEGQQWGADHGLEIDQYGVENIELIKGAASLQHGSDGMGGVLNILPFKVPEDSSFKARILTNYKSNNDLIGANAMATGRKKALFFRISVTRQDFADYRVPAKEFTYNTYILPIYNQRLKNTAGNETGASLTLGIKKQKGHSQLTFSNYQTTFGMFSGALGIPRAYQLFDDGNTRDIQLPSQVVNHFKITSNTVWNIGTIHTIENDAGYQYNHREEMSNPASHGYISNSNVALGLDLHTYTNNLRVKSMITNKWLVTNGLSAQYQTNTRSGFEHLLPDFSTLHTGIFSLHQYAISSRLVATGGIRFDYSYSDLKSYTQPANIFQTTDMIRNEAIYRSFQNISGAIGLSWIANDALILKMNAGKTFKSPTPPELAANGIHHGTFRHEMGNANLVPENGYQLDVSGEWKKKNYTCKLSPFFNYFDQFIYLAPSGTFSTFPDGGQLYRYTQTNAIYSGFEAETDIKLASRFSLNVNAEYVYNINLSNGLGLPFTPPATVYAMPEFTLIDKGKIRKLNIGFSTQYVAAQYRIDRNELPTDGYTLFHVHSSCSLMLGKVEAKVNFQVNNLTNTSYLNHLSRYRLLNLPEQGRNLMLSIQLAI
jgi:iron complex outermembrane receptor protein